MKSRGYWPLVGGLVLVGGLSAHSIYEFVAINDGLTYFLSEPRRLLYALLVGVAGGAIAFGVSRFSPAGQRNLKLMVLGSAFGPMAMAFCFMFYQFINIDDRILDNAGRRWIVATMGSLALMAVLICFEFRQVWRKR